MFTSKPLFPNIRIVILSLLFYKGEPNKPPIGYTDYCFTYQDYCFGCVGWISDQESCSFEGVKRFAMNEMRRFETINDYNVFNNNETKHPLVSVVDFSKAAPRQGSLMYFGFYTIILKDVVCGDLVYGRHTYDYQEGVKSFLEKRKPNFEKKYLP